MKLAKNVGKEGFSSQNSSNLKEGKKEMLAILKKRCLSSEIAYS